MVSEDWLVSGEKTHVFGVESVVSKNSSDLLTSSLFSKAQFTFYLFPGIFPDLSVIILSISVFLWHFTYSLPLFIKVSLVLWVKLGSAAGYEPQNCSVFCPNSTSHEFSILDWQVFWCLVKSKASIHIC